MEITTAKKGAPRLLIVSAAVAFILSVITFTILVFPDQWMTLCDKASISFGSFDTIAHTGIKSVTLDPTCTPVGSIGYSLILVTPCVLIIALILGLIVLKNVPTSKIKVLVTVTAILAIIFGAIAVLAINNYDKNLELYFPVHPRINPL